MEFRRPIPTASFHYKNYLLEKMGYDGAFEDPHGFITYKQISATEMRIGSIYVEPSKRQFNIGTELANKVRELAVSKGCTVLSCSNHITNPEEDRCAQIAILKYGFMPVQSHNNETLYIMNIQENQ